MYLNRFIPRVSGVPLAKYMKFRSISIECDASIIVGKSGRVYVQGKTLRPPYGKDKGGVFKARSDGEPFVLKRGSRRIYDHCQRLTVDFPDSTRLRMHIDSNDEQCTLVYPFFTTTLLSFLKTTEDEPEVSIAERKKILRHVGEAIKELHEKGWAHFDIKPDNILIQLVIDEQGDKVVTDVVLGDFDDAVKMRAGLTLNTNGAIGNVIWRSPEGHIGNDVNKASDIFSYGLVCIHTLGLHKTLIPDFQELAKRGIAPEQEIVTRHFCYFGPVSKTVIDRSSDKDWRDFLREASNMSNELVAEQPYLRFEAWGEELGTGAKNMIKGMTRLESAMRTSIDQVLDDDWWNEED